MHQPRYPSTGAPQLSIARGFHQQPQATLHAGVKASSTDLRDGTLMCMVNRHVAQALRAAARELLLSAGSPLLYHGTRGALAARIAEEGLRSDSGFSNFGGQVGVSMTTDPRVADDFGGAVFVFDATELKRAGYELTPVQHPSAPNEKEIRVSKGGRTTEIPPKFIKELRLARAQAFEIRWWNERNPGFPVVSA